MRKLENFKRFGCRLRMPKIILDYPTFPFNIEHLNFDAKRLNEISIEESIFNFLPATRSKREPIL